MLQVFTMFVLHCLDAGVRTYPESVSCQVTLTGLRFVLFSSISALLILNPSVEITHGCFVPIEATQDAHLLSIWRMHPPRLCRPLSPHFELPRLPENGGCLSGARECSQAGLPPVPHARGCVHLLCPARACSAPPRCGYANSRRQLPRAEADFGQLCVGGVTMQALHFPTVERSVADWSLQSTKTKNRQH